MDVQIPIATMGISTISALPAKVFVCFRNKY